MVVMHLSYWKIRLSQSAPIVTCPVLLVPLLLNKEIKMVNIYLNKHQKNALYTKTLHKKICRCVQGKVWNYILLDTINHAETHLDNDNSSGINIVLNDKMHCAEMHCTVHFHEVRGHN